MNITMILFEKTKLMISHQVTNHLKEILMEQQDYRPLMSEIHGAFHNLNYDHYSLITIEDNSIKLI